MLQEDVILRSLNRNERGVLRILKSMGRDFRAVFPIRRSITVDSSNEHRIWAIAKDLLGSSEYSSIIKIYNGIRNVHYIPAGTTINAPEISEFLNVINTELTQRSLNDPNTIITAASQTGSNLPATSQSASSTTKFDINSGRVRISTRRNR